MEPGSWVCRCCAYRAIPGLPRPLLCPDDGLPLVPQETAERHPEDLLLGTILDGRYAVVDILPVRGPARIYQALQLPGKQEISVHAPPPDEPEHIVERRRFADIAAQLADHRHPGLLGLLDHGWLEERGGYVVTEPYRGTTLAEWAKGGGRPSSWAAALAMAVPCIEALVAPHERGLVHGAVNPSRLLLEEQPPAGAGKEGGPLRLRLMGLGLEQLFPPRRKMSHDVAALRINLDVATASTMSPEEIEQRNLGPSSDVYSFGCVLHQLVTGEPPFPGQRTLEIIAGHLGGLFPESRLAAVATPELAAVLARACARDPAHRFTDARQLLQALDAVPIPLQPDFATIKREIRRPSRPPATAGGDVGAEQLLTPAAGLPEQVAPKEMSVDEDDWGGRETLLLPALRLPAPKQAATGDRRASRQSPAAPAVDPAAAPAGEAAPAPAVDTAAAPAAVPPAAPAAVPPAAQTTRPPARGPDAAQAAADAEPPTEAAAAPTVRLPPLAELLAGSVAAGDAGDEDANATVRLPALSEMMAALAARAAEPAGHAAPAAPLRVAAGEGGRKVRLPAPDAPPDATVVRPAAPAAAPVPRQKEGATSLLPPLESAGRETMVLEALDPNLIKLQEEYQQRQEEAARAEAAAKEAAAEAERQAALRQRRQRLLTRAVIGCALLLGVASAAAWIVLHQREEVLQLDPELQAFLDGLQTSGKADALAAPRRPEEQRAEAAASLTELADSALQALMESQQQLEVVQAQLRSQPARGTVKAAAGELLGLAQELRTIRREVVELKLVLPGADPEQIRGIAANARRLRFNLLEVRATARAALDELLESIPGQRPPVPGHPLPAASSGHRPAGEHGAAAVRGSAPVAVATGPPGLPPHRAEQPRPAEQQPGQPPQPPAVSPTGDSVARLASAPPPDAAALLAAAVRAEETDKAGGVAGGQAGSPGGVAALSDEDLLTRVLGHQERGPIAVSGLPCSCDPDRLYRSADGGRQGETLDGCELKACWKIPPGNQRFSEIAYQLSRYHNARKQYRQQLLALERATRYGRYSHDPSVLFVLIAVAAHQGKFDVALEAKDRFLYLKHLLPPNEARRKVPEAFRILGQAFEQRYYRLLEDDPDKADPALIHRAIDYMERYADYSGRQAEVETKLKELRTLQREATGGAP